MKALLPCLLLAALATPAHARPFKELCDQFEPLRKLSDLKYVKPVIKVKPEADKVKPQDIAFTLEARSGAIKVVPAADGTIDFPFSEALCLENPNLGVNQAKGSLGMVISIDPSIPPVRETRLSAARIAAPRAWTSANPSIVLSDLPKKIGLAFKS